MAAWDRQARRRRYADRVGAPHKPVPRSAAAPARGAAPAAPPQRAAARLRSIPGHASQSSEIRLAITVDIFTSAEVIQKNSSGPAVAAGPPFREAALYMPVKEFLERRGYEVKGEVRGCDLVARRGDEPMVVVELKLRLSLALVLQGVDRLALTERVYLAVPRPSSQRRRSRGPAPDSPDVRMLCRRLGLGLLLVGPRSVEIIEEPVPYRPRPAKLRVLRLKDEFDRRLRDANIGGT